MSANQLVVPREARAFQGHTAGLVTRSCAAVVDGLVVGICLVAVYIGWNGFRFLLDPRRFTFSDPNLLRSMTAAWLLAALYLGASWGLTGRSYGCHLMGVRVVSRRGGRLGLWTAFLRAVLCASFPIGLLWCAGGRGHRSVQDILVGSRVLYDWTTQASAAPPAHLIQPG